MLRLPRPLCILQRMARQEKSSWEESYKAKTQLRADRTADLIEANVDVPTVASNKHPEPRSSRSARSCLEKIPSSADKSSSQFADADTLIQELEELFNPTFLAPLSPAENAQNSLGSDDEFTCPGHNFIRLDSDLDLGSRDAWGWPVFRPKNPYDEDLYGLDLHSCRYRKWRPKPECSFGDRGIQVGKLSNVHSEMYSDTLSPPESDEDEWQTQWRREHSSFTSTSSSSTRGKGGCYKIFCGKSSKPRGGGREYLAVQHVSAPDLNVCTPQNGFTLRDLNFDDRITTAGLLERRLKAMYRPRPIRGCKKYCREGSGHLCSSPYYIYYQTCNFDVGRVRLLQKCQWNEVACAL